MTTMCPICNGFVQLHELCDACGSMLIDEGRIEQMYGPYSAYREIDHLKLTDGYIDVSSSQCIHVANCPECQRQQMLFIHEVESF